MRRDRGRGGGREVAGPGPRRARGTAPPRAAVQWLRCARPHHQPWPATRLRRVPQRSRSSRERTALRPPGVRRRRRRVRGSVAGAAPCARGPVPRRGARHLPAARTPAGLHRRPPHRRQRAPPRRHPRGRRRPRRQDHLARPRPDRRLPDHEAPPPRRRGRPRPPAGGRADPGGRRLRPGDLAGGGAQRRVGAGRPRGAAPGRSDPGLRPAAGRRGVRPAAERPGVRPPTPASAARTASSPRSASASRRA